jgi:hypothetical protein
MERKNTYAKFICKEKINGRLNEYRIERRRKIQQSTTLIREFYAKTKLKKERE